MPATRNEPGLCREGYLDEPAELASAKGHRELLVRTPQLRLDTRIVRHVAAADEKAQKSFVAGVIRARPEAR